MVAWNTRDGRRGFRERFGEEAEPGAENTHPYTIAGLPSATPLGQTKQRLLPAALVPAAIPKAPAPGWHPSPAHEPP